MRWLQNDPLGFDAGDGNLYRDVGNNPANVTDPTGLMYSVVLQWMPTRPIGYPYRPAFGGARPGIGGGVGTSGGIGRPALLRPGWGPTITSSKPETKWPGLNNVSSLIIPDSVLARYQRVYLLWQWLIERRPWGLPQCATQNYPPRWLERGILKVALLTDKTSGSDGFLWINANNQHKGIKGFVGLKGALNGYTNGSIDLLVISGHGSAGETCGAAASVNAITEGMPADVAAFISSKLSPTAVVVIAACESGMYPEQVQAFANALQRPVSAAKGTCRGLRDDYYEWAMGGYAENGYVTKPPRQPEGR